ncbi:hypothetical protein PGA94_09150 [Pediococcus pentosaceus]|uniref:hypothetical protein n=1 Tax=Pediococcus pentosaceus TaxID=1255 RepID=UPI00232DDA6F|nr:hypothetical protein [Pediococcus pentosaceus]MDB1562939.1 hypothetical protein [Pediococcus pentosaceus]
MTEVYVVDSRKKDGDIDKHHLLTHYNYEINSDIEDVISYDNKFYVITDKEAIFASDEIVGYELYVEEV